MPLLKANILFKDRVSLPDLDIDSADDDDDLQFLLTDTTTWVSELFRGLRHGRFNLKLHHSIELSQPYYIQSDELENKEPQEIVFTRFRGTGENVIVHFKIKRFD